ncbi:MAG: molybdopterin-guanine dinucleotide biosynthesis protein B [Chloroflexi bacterium]|nr:molybdopterin-guanine dinucleotide biosynthesis protein B [Chloroflexota bacterium]MBU1746625.1 molybdopterin-guanine dinucleotide biosynthesis protein B [Chloroflexota bacterium]
MLPIISFVGKSGTGKTTFLVRVVAELKRRGWRVAVVKHDVHGFDIDQPGKDSWRMAQAGADAVLISGPNKFALIHQVARERTIDELAALVAGDVDILLTEGYKRGPKPKVEISRAMVSQELLCTADELVALVTDQTFPDRPDLDAVPRFALNDAAGVADLLTTYIEAVKG